MKGYEITFFTQEDHLHGLKQMSEWLLLTARDLGLRGATVVTGSEGFGHSRHIHSALLRASRQPAGNRDDCQRGRGGSLV